MSLPQHPIQRIGVDLRNGLTMSVITGYGAYSDPPNTYEVAFWPTCRRTSWRTGQSRGMVEAPGFAPNHWNGGVYSRVPVEQIIAYGESVGLKNGALQGELRAIGAA